ncbi:hypothetical protein SADUNF_Sadunf19G0068800 [Salix dunnii]|uniref:Uncharacterized protein n=1 Tax=Salix dunnii TaxID=1413687 RepID=A0A835J484_9ROSI|nr:hypothetical protein SADUNF_Sadunf19G0068800 [Salix dunnii]
MTQSVNIEDQMGSISKYRVIQRCEYKAWLQRRDADSERVDEQFLVSKTELIEELMAGKTAMFKFLSPRLRLQSTDIQTAACWGVAAGTTALWVVQLSAFPQKGLQKLH